MFFDVGTTRPELLAIEREYAVVRAELDAVLARGELVMPYHEFDPSQYAISAGGERKWNVCFVYSRGADRLPGALACPRTAALVSSIPGALVAFFSILEPGKSVPAHEGRSFLILRAHLGLRVPEVSPPRIRVKDQVHEWKEGELVVFDDSWEHQVTNEAQEERIVLIVDFMRPMPFRYHVLNRFVQWLNQPRSEDWERFYERLGAAAAERRSPLAEAPPGTASVG